MRGPAKGRRGPSRGRRLWRNLSLVLALIVGARPAASPADPGEAGSSALEFGLLPFASAGTLFERFAPLREYLETRLKRPVRLRTAPDFPTFVRRTLAGRYHIVLTAPHFTLMALDSGRYQARATYRERLSAVVIARPGASSEGAAGCRTVATPPPSAVITLLGKDYLARNYPEDRRTFIAYASHNAAVQAVIGGDACLAVVSVNVWNRVRNEAPGLRRIATTPAIPALGILVRRDLPAAVKRRVTRALVGMGDHPQGRRALEGMDYPGYRPAQAATFEPARRFLELLPKGWPGPADSQ